MATALHPVQTMKHSTQSGSGAIPWGGSSLRGRIAFLAGSVVVLLTLMLCILIWVLRTTQANVVLRSQRHIEAVSRSLANAYQDRTDTSVSLSSAGANQPRGPEPKRHPKPDTHNPPPEQLSAAAGEPPPPPPPLPPGGPQPPSSPQERALAALTARVLQDETGIEGGFYRAADQRLVGYAFPTHEGPGDQTALPARESPDIVALARTAVEQHKQQEESFFGPHDVVLFVAVPICETKSCTGGPTGAAWLMHRLHGAESDRRRTLLWSAFGFATVACVTVLLAYLALRQVGLGTAAVLDRLTTMESSLSRHPHPASVRLAEFHRVLDGLDGLGETLREQMERERELHARLRQNERLAAIGQLSAGVAHELRNPLATIRLRAQMAQRKSLEGSTAQATFVILAEVDRLDAIIERLLDFARPIRLTLSSVDVSAMAQAAVDRWSVRNPDVAFRYSGEPQVCAFADPIRLEQVFDNVLENAVNQLEDAKHGSPRIEVSCNRDDEQITIEVADNGGGFSPAALLSATEPFFTTRARGTGLGLAITKEIVSALSGSLLLSNDADGARVRIQLPANLSC